MINSVTHRGMHLRISAPALVALGLASFAGIGPVHAGEEINTGYFGGIAIKGYDPVAYFTESRAVQGSPDISFEWLGAVWHFANAEHRTAFATTPVKYAPQYGGYCADGVAYGETTANIDPEAWVIIDGRLYLNYDKGAAKEFEEVVGQMAKAEANWPKIKARLTE